ncbi:MAG: hypothetical protein ACRC37_08465 [Lentisphaeria bacterium]
MENLFELQVQRLQEQHFLLLYWSALAEDKGMRYNITNAFDDLKYARLTRTKQTAVANIEALSFLNFIELKDESNRKNIYITKFGAEALTMMVSSGNFKVKKSSYLEVNR